MIDLYLFVVLGTIVVLGGVLVAQLSQLGRADLLDTEELLGEELPDAARSEGLACAFEDDSNFIFDLNGLSPERRHQLSQTRRQARSLFLRNLWRDFHRAWSVGKLLAPLSEDPEFGVLLVRRRAAFCFLYAQVWFRFALGFQRNFHEDLETLAHAVRGLRETARRLAQSTQLELPHSAISAL